MTAISMKESNIRMSELEKEVSYQELLARGRSFLEEKQVSDAETDSFLLLEYVTGMNRGQFFLKSREAAKSEEAKKYDMLLKRRGNHIPLQHITGKQEFMGLSFLVNEHVLVPRQDTECLVELALPYVKGKKVLDMCTGSGCIAVSLAALGETGECHAADISEKALEIARQNIAENHAEVTLIKSNLFESVSGKYDVIVSNPPYIPPKVIETLSEEVREHEPRLALDGGEDGLEFYRRITSESKEYLTAGGYLFYEIGCEQAEDVKAIMRNEGFLEVECRKDYAGNDRVVYGKL